MPRLERFKEAQDQPGSGFESALAEMKTDTKQSHWIWYVFPQLSGLGASSFSQIYGIDGLAEAEEYLHDPILFSRLLTITTAVAERLRSARRISVETLMGSHIDALKLVSSLTLFGTVVKKLFAAEENDAYAALARVADEVLAVAAAEGYPPCRLTIARLER